MDINDAQLQKLESVASSLEDEAQSLRALLVSSTVSVQLHPAGVTTIAKSLTKLGETISAITQVIRKGKP
jgi:hypothetical protein